MNCWTHTNLPGQQTAVINGWQCLFEMIAPGQAYRAKVFGEDAADVRYAVTRSTESRAKQDAQTWAESNVKEGA